MDFIYPFKPKSNKTLIPGQYWAIPLKEGKFACGRVVQVTRNYMASPTKTFLAGLIDWVGDIPPTYEAIAGKKILEQGVVHVMCIHETAVDEMLTGYRPLDLDFIEPDYFRSQTGYQPGLCMLMKGLGELRTINIEEWQKYSTLGIWGTDYIRHLAEEKLFN